jgi:hypothetical protein
MGKGRMWLWAGVLAAAAQGATAWAATGRNGVTVTQEQQQEVAITIYNINLGLVKDVRRVQLPVGVGEVKFMDVAAQINPTTVHLKALGDPRAVKILEQNYEYDLLTPQKLMEKYVGKTLKVFIGDVSTDATLLSTNGGEIYRINGTIHLGRPGRVIIPHIPEELIAKPTLVWLLRNSAPAEQRVEASYLTGGVTWKADYVFTLNARDDRGDLTGWVTIDNKSGASYPNAVLKLVAGDVNQVKDEVRRLAMAESVAKAARADERDFKQESFFEYHVYALQGRSTIKDNQTKQISFLGATEVPVTKRLIYSGHRQYYRHPQTGIPMGNQKIGVYLEVENREKAGLGVPLPKGVVRVYKADGTGSLQFVGEDRIDHTPKDERVRIKMGEAFDVVGERVQRDWRKIAPSVYEVEWEITLRNHKAEPVTVQVVEPVPGDWQILRSTHKAEKLEAHTLGFTVAVPKDGEAKLAYRVRLTF